MLDALFSLGGTLAMLGWLGLVVAAFVPPLRRWVWPVSGGVIPALLAVAYAGLIGAYWSGSPGGYESLAAVRALFDTPGLLLAGWLHYLAFDLFIGVWIARAGVAAGIPAPLLVVCFVLTFLFGPVGLGLYWIFKIALAIPRTEAVAS